MNYEINNEAINTVNEGTEIPSFLYDEDGVKAWHLKYISTDGWRGYYEAKATKNGGWTKIDYDGWVTGNWDDAPEDAKSNNVEDRLEKLASEYEAKGYKLAVVFAPTSNVFSTAFDVFIKQK